MGYLLFPNYARPHTKFRTVPERRNQARHPAYAKPELLATGPNQVWSWDITKLKGPNKGQFFNLYVILDIFSRAVVGWLLAAHLIAEACKRHGIRLGALTIHADRGAPMTGHLDGAAARQPGRRQKPFPVPPIQ